MTSEKRSPTYVVYHFDTQRLSPTRVCKKYIYIYMCVCVCVSVKQLQVLLQFKLVDSFNESYIYKE